MKMRGPKYESIMKFSAGIAPSVKWLAANWSTSFRFWVGAGFLCLYRCIITALITVWPFGVCYPLSYNSTPLYTFLALFLDWSPELRSLSPVMWCHVVCYIRGCISLSEELATSTFRIQGIVVRQIRNVVTSLPYHLAWHSRKKPWSWYSPSWESEIW
jgi:hypothetical protein